MLTIKYHAAFKKDYKRVKKRGCDPKQLERVIGLLAAQKKLPARYRDHELTGNYRGCRECHLAPDWLLVYLIDQQELVLCLTRTGTHSDLFG